MQRRGAQRRNRNGKYWRTHRGITPSEERLQCRPADSPLAGAHAAACLQLCIGPVLARHHLFFELAKAHILTAAHNRIGLSQPEDLRTQRECASHRTSERNFSVTPPIEDSRGCGLLLRPPTRRSCLAHLRHPRPRRLSVHPHNRCPSLKSAALHSPRRQSL